MLAGEFLTLSCKLETNIFTTNFLVFIKGHRNPGKNLTGKGGGQKEGGGGRVP